MENTHHNEESALNRIFIILVIGIILFVAGYSAVIIALTWPISRFSVEASGTFGDSFGLLTSLFSGLAFAGIIWTVLLQRVELKLQRKELQEARRQSILTRLMTVTQNAVTAYRAELSPLKFESINDSEERIPLNFMLFEMLHKMKEVSEKHKDVQSDPIGYLDDIREVLALIANNIHAYEILIEGLSRRCNANRYLLANEEISASEAQDIKSLFFSELPSKLVQFIFWLDTLLKIYVVILKDHPNKDNCYEWFKSLKNECGNILGHRNLKYSEEILGNDRKEKWLFSEEAM